MANFGCTNLRENEIIGNYLFASNNEPEMPDDSILESQVNLVGNKMVWHARLVENGRILLVLQICMDPVLLTWASLEQMDSFLDLRSI